MKTTLESITIEDKIRPDQKEIINYIKEVDDVSYSLRRLIEQVMLRGSREGLSPVVCDDIVCVTKLTELIENSVANDN